LRIKRITARVLPVDREGRVLLQLGRDRFPRADRYWLTIGGGKARGETLPQAGAREMYEEAGIEVDPAMLGEPIGTTVIKYAAFGVLPVLQYQTYFAAAVDGVAVRPAHQSLVERLGIERHEWLTTEQLECRPERIADPALPGLMRAAVALVRDRGDHG
jgi:8-oxo-dGTP pyrophosphatase MutT (NUDIX family)